MAALSAITPEATEPERPPIGAEDLERAARAFANDHFGPNKWDALTPEEQMPLGESVRAALLALNLPIEDQK